MPATGTSVLGRSGERELLDRLPANARADLGIALDAGPRHRFDTALVGSPPHASEGRS